MSLSLVRQYRPTSPLIATTVISTIALQPSVSPLPLILLLTGILLQTSHIASSGHDQTSHSLGLILSLGLGGVLARLIPSLHALSTPATSIVVLIAGSFATSFLYFIPVLLYVIVLTTHPPTPPFQRLLSLFPAIWASYLALISYLSPFGRMGTWSPVLSNEGAYSWLTPYLGAPGQDWLVAASAVLLARIFQTSELIPYTTRCVSLIDEPTLIDITDEPNDRQALLSPYRDDNDNYGTVEVDRTSSSSKSLVKKSTHGYCSTIILATTLVALAIPSYLTPSLPVAPYSPSTIPLNLACILPQPASEASPTTIFDTYLAETMRYGSLARIHLWPESAVRFENRREMEERLEAVRLIAALYKIWVGVGLEYTVPASEGGKRRNGVVVVGPEGVVLEYYKHNLVPIAESFSIIPGQLPPSIATLPIPYGPKSRRGNQKILPLDISASICLDFAHPYPLLTLPSRPTLILAPADTWEVSIGDAMRSQAKMRADEVGSRALWCDGGKGGVSGVVGGGEDGINVGRGSFVKSIGVPLQEDPKDEERAKTRTVYAWGGDLMVLAMAWGVVLVAWKGDGAVKTLKNVSAGGVRVQPTWERVREYVGGVYGSARRRLGGRGEQQPNVSLIDDS